MRRMSEWALFFVVAGGLLQLSGLWWTVRQIRLVVRVRKMVWEHARDVARRLGRDTSTDTRSVAVEVPFRFDVALDFEARIVGESETDRLSREVQSHRRLIADLDRKLSHVEDRAQRALDDRLDELNRETEEKAQRNAELMWWGVVLIGAGIAAQTVGALL